MQFSISERLKPFEQVKGASCPLPGSNYSLKIYPSLISFFDLSESQPLLTGEIKVGIKGPVTEFTVQLNLEKGNISVFGRGLEGYFRYSLTALANSEGLIIRKEKAVNQEILFELQSKKFNQFGKNDHEILIMENDQADQSPYTNTGFDRLSLGNHKSQDWMLVKRRKDLKEIFPIWLRLGEMMKVQGNDDFTGTAALLKNCEESIKEGGRNEILKPFETLFEAGFQGIMTPTLFDETHQGLKLPEVKKCSAQVLLSYGAKLIRSLFATYEEGILSLLPALPVAFHSGRFLHFKCKDLALLDLEWSKKMIRRMILIVEKDGLIELKFQPDVKRYRLRNELGTMNLKCEVGTKLKVEKGNTYYFDCFQK